MPPAELRCEDINGSFLSIADWILVTYVQNTCSARADACSYLEKFPWQGWAVGDRRAFLYRLKSFRPSLDRDILCILDF